MTTIHENGLTEAVKGNEMKGQAEQDNQKRKKEKKRVWGGEERVDGNRDGTGNEEEKEYDRRKQKREEKKVGERFPPLAVTGALL